LPSVLPRAVPGRGLTVQQRRRRQVSRALAAAGFVEAVIPPWIGQKALDALDLPEGDDRRNVTRVANPLSDDQDLLRTTLLPGLLTALARNGGRGLRDVGLFEIGAVVRPGASPLPPAPRPTTEHRPGEAELAALQAALPHQPVRVGIVAAEQRARPTWSGPGRPASWQDAIEAARTVAHACGVSLRVAADRHAPWHPGRCAALYVGDVLVGHAGELHPRVCAAYDVPARTVAAELGFDLLLEAEPGLAVAPVVSPFPATGRDVALVVDATVAAADVEAALAAGAGPLLEGVRLFDRYAGAQVGEGKVSLAYRLTFRAGDRTLTDDDANAARDAALAVAAERTGAVVRG
jgi:phenylalanyl-tRNA synthetase beta chain